MKNNGVGAPAPPNIPEAMASATKETSQHDFIPEDFRHDFVAEAMASAKPLSATNRAAYVALFVAIIVAWVALDQLVKQAFMEMPVGKSAGTILGGLIDLTVVHNTGAAWGVFAGNPVALGVFSLVVCAILVAYFFATLNRSSWLKTIGLALIVAGGIGNAIDRFTQGYVLDFFATTFMDFPVFNVADIAVTCGVPLFLLGVYLLERKGKMAGE